MTDGTDGSLAGRPLDEAAEAAVARGDVEDRERARAVLRKVSEDGTVGRAGVDAALDHAAELVSRLERRLQIAVDALEDAREAAGPDVERPVVRARLDEIDALLASVEDRVERVDEELQDLRDRRVDEETLYDFATAVHHFEAKARGCQQAVDEVAGDVRELDRWLANAEVRFRTLREEADEYGRSLDRLSASVDGVVGGEGQVDPNEWLDTSVEHRVLGLVLADLRWELAVHDRWAEAEEVAELSADLEDRLDELAATHGSIGDRLEDATPGGAAQRRLTAVEGDLDDLEPPVDWGAVEATLDDHRAD